MSAVRKLTSLENKAMLSGLNVSDGHPRMPLTTGQRTIMDGLSALYDESLTRSFDEIEKETHRSFLHGIGQLQAPVATGRLVSCYSSSVAIDIVARALAERVSHVALIHPTFDNIADLLRARGLTLLPLSQQQMADDPERLPDGAGAVFIVSPNNPTGWVLPKPSLERLAAECSRTGRVLVLDACFRGQDQRAQYDTYATLGESGVEWVVVEDTGKLWPVQELKAGFLAWSEHTTLSLRDAFDDVLLSVSPFVLLLLTRLAEDATAGGYGELHHLIAANRRMMTEIVEPPGFSVADSQSRISVARLTVPPEIGTAPDLYRSLFREGVHILPCEAFYWADAAAGRQDLRIALSRSPEQVATAARLLAKVAAQRVGSTLCARLM